MSATEPLSQTLRRLIATVYEEESCERIDDALPALADLVEATESEHALRHGVPGGQKDVGQCFHQCCRALAALRERLAVKP